MTVAMRVVDEDGHSCADRHRTRCGSAWRRGRWPSGAGTSAARSSWRWSAWTHATPTPARGHAGEDDRNDPGLPGDPPRGVVGGRPRPGGPTAPKRLGALKRNSRAKTPKCARAHAARRGRQRAAGDDHPQLRVARVGGSRSPSAAPATVRAARTRSPPVRPCRDDGVERAGPRCRRRAPRPTSNTTRRSSRPWTPTSDGRTRRARRRPPSPGGMRERLGA